MSTENSIKHEGPNNWPDLITSSIEVKEDPLVTQDMVVQTQVVDKLVNNNMNMKLSPPQGPDNIRHEKIQCYTQNTDTLVNQTVKPESSKNLSSLLPGNQIKLEPENSSTNENALEDFMNWRNRLTKYEGLNLPLPVPATQQGLALPSPVPANQVKAKVRETWRSRLRGRNKKNKSKSPSKSPSKLGGKKRTLMEIYGKPETTTTKKRTLMEIYAEKSGRNNEIEVISDAQLEKEFNARLHCQFEKHPLDKDRADIPLRHRYVDKNFEFRKKSLRETSRAKRGMGKRIETEAYEMCNHRVHRPVLSQSRCHHCALKHGNSEEDCPIFLYHRQRPLRLAHRKVFRSFPCLFCDSTDHNVHMCPQMHAYCMECGKRGHRYYKNDPQTYPSHPKADVTNKSASKFQLYAQFGCRTRKAQGVLSHRWGFVVPDDHSCGHSKTSNFSEDEDYSEEELPEMDQITTTSNLGRKNWRPRK